MLKIVFVPKVICWPVLRSAIPTDKHLGKGATAAAEMEDAQIDSERFLKHRPNESGSIRKACVVPMKAVMPLLESS